MSKVNIPFSFDATQHDPASGGLTVIPTGEYVAKIVDIKEKENNAKTGKLLALFLEVIEGEQAGALLIHNLNHVNPSAQAVEIAMGEFSAICHVTGVLQLQNLGQLCEKPFKIRVEKTTYEKDGKEIPTNNIKGFLDMAGNPPVKGQIPQVGTTAPASANTQAAQAPQTAQNQPQQAPSFGSPPIQNVSNEAPSGQNNAPAGWGGNQPQQAPNAAGFANPNA